MTRALVLSTLLLSACAPAGKIQNAPVVKATPTSAPIVKATPMPESGDHDDKDLKEDYADYAGLKSDLKECGYLKNRFRGLMEVYKSYNEELYNSISTLEAENQQLKMQVQQLLVERSN